jgi:preprotein translocase subunit YajC
MFNVLMEAGTQTAAGNPQSNVFAQLFPFILMFGILYLLIIRPQRKRQRETQKMLTNLKVSDVVVTNGGIIGKITNIKKEKNIVVLRVDEASKTKIEFQKTAIVGIIKNEEKKA